MKRISRASLLLPVLLLLANTGSLLALDLTLHRKMSVADAISVERVFFTDGTSKIYLQLPPKWAVADSPQALNFTPDRVQTSVRVEQMSGLKSLVFDEPTKIILRQRLASAEIPGATDVKTEAETPDALSILDWKSLEITQSYQFNGQAFQRSTLFLDLGASRVLQVTVYAPVKDFDDLHKETFRMMSSWFEPSKDLPPELARQYEN